MQGGSSHGASGHSGYANHGDYSGTGASGSEHSWLPSGWSASLASYRQSSTTLPSRQAPMHVNSQPISQTHQQASTYESQPSYQNQQQQQSSNSSHTGPSDWYRRLPTQATQITIDRPVVNQAHVDNGNTYTSDTSRLYESDRASQQASQSQAAAQYRQPTSASLAAVERGYSSTQTASPTLTERPTTYAQPAPSSYSAQDASLQGHIGISPATSPHPPPQPQDRDPHREHQTQDRQRPATASCAPASKTAVSSSSAAIDLGSRVPVTVSPDQLHHRPPTERRPSLPTSGDPSPGQNAASGQQRADNSSAAPQAAETQPQQKRKRHSRQRTAISRERHLELGFEPMDDFDSDDPHVNAAKHPCTACYEQRTKCVIPPLRRGFGEGTVWRGSCVPCGRRKGGCAMSSHVGPYEWKPGPGNVLERVLKPAHVLKANSIARERAKAARRETLGESAEDSIALSEMGQVPLPDLEGTPDPSMVEAALEATASDSQMAPEVPPGRLARLLSPDSDGGSSAVPPPIRPQPTHSMAPASQPIRQQPAVHSAAARTATYPAPTPRAAPPPVVRAAPQPPPQSSLPPSMAPPAFMQPSAPLVPLMTPDGVPLTAFPPPDPYGHISHENLVLLIHQKDQVIRHLQSLLSKHNVSAPGVPAAPQTAPAAAAPRAPPAPAHQPTALKRKRDSAPATITRRPTPPIEVAPLPQPEVMVHNPVDHVPLPRKRGRPPLSQSAKKQTTKKPPRKSAPARLAPAPAPEPAAPALQPVQDPEKEYEVEKIVEMSVVSGSGERFFQVRWVGYGDEYNTWEPEDEVEHLEAFESYMEAHPHLDLRKQPVVKSDSPASPRHSPSPTRFSSVASSDDGRHSETPPPTRRVTRGSSVRETRPRRNAARNSSIAPRAVPSSAGRVTRSRR